MALAVILKGPFQRKMSVNPVHQNCREYGLETVYGKIMFIISSLVLSTQILRMLILEMKRETLHRAVSYP